MHRHYPGEWSFDSLALSEDGERLNAVSQQQNTILRIATDQGTVAGQLPDGDNAFSMLRVVPRQ